MTRGEIDEKLKEIQETIPLLVRLAYRDGYNAAEATLKQRIADLELEVAGQQKIKK